LYAFVAGSVFRAEGNHNGGGCNDRGADEYSGFQVFTHFSAGSAFIIFFS
jgi:hypothetical protein